MTLTRNHLEERYRNILSDREIDRPDNLKEKSGKSWWKTILRIVITVALFVFLLKSVSWILLFQTLKHLRYDMFLLGLVAGVVCILFSAYGWRTLILAEHIRYDLARLIHLYLIGMAFSHFLPTNMGGDAIKAFYVGRESANMAGATSTVLMSRVTSFLGMLLIALPGLLILHREFSVSTITWFLVLSLLLIMAITSTIAVAAILPAVSTRFLKHAWSNTKTFNTIISVSDAMRAVSKRPAALGGAVVFGMLFWIASFANYYGYAMALNMHVPFSFYVVAIPLVSIVAALPISINGFGVREGAFVYIFSTIHVPTTTSLLLVLLMDAQVFFFGLIGGCIYLSMGLRGQVK
ncbi:MAG TPA: lysylphosphatidylglycerol synthase transmembrane domain-containing protein [Ktedonobacteraceae bacterium]